MRTVRLFADTFDWSEHTTDRAKRAMESAAHGVGRKAAGPVVVLDALISVLDAIGAYARLRQSREITCQLEAEGETLRRQLEELLQQHKLKCKAADARVQANLKEMRLLLAQQAQTLQFEADEFDALSRHIKKLGQLITAQRPDAPPNCQPLVKLEDAYYRLVDLQLHTLMESVGG
jgi:hypothetical protein